LKRTLAQAVQRRKRSKHYDLKININRIEVKAAVKIKAGKAG
jgi:hypothetical protein